MKKGRLKTNNMLTPKHLLAERIFWQPLSTIGLVSKMPSIAGVAKIRL